ncbi:MAG: toprim domain-containing protein [Nocardioidaceae bacterium]|nr:toprim domain-containing protein [Nocardioidaceae bacterium]
MASRFHSYSFNNTLLICAQRPDATHVAGYQVWRQLGRQVDKGEHGIQILAPVVGRGNGRDEPGDAAASAASGGDGSAAEHAGADRDDRQVVGFRVAHVFDISQTSGEPLPQPERPKLLIGEAPGALWDQLAAQVDGRGFTLERGPCVGERNGYTDFVDHRVVIRDDVDDAQAVKTLAHELGHVLMHGPDALAARDTRICRGSAEVEAESVAYLVTAARGLDVAGYTFPYVAQWAATAGSHADVVDIVQRSAVHVLRTARHVLATADETVRPAARDSLPAIHRTEVGLSRTAALRGRAEALATGGTPGRQPLGTDVGRIVDRTLAANAAAAAWWGELLRRPDQAGPRQYLVDRGTGHVLEAESPWQVGYAENRWTSLVEHLRASGFTDSDLLDAGLAMTSRKGNVVDRFRDRIMLPIRRPDGGTVGFIGRAAPSASPDVPKYLNTASTAAFSKGDVLFGLAEQSQTIGRGRTLIVEGPFDVLAVAGVRPDTAAVAPCGTALTDRQVAVLADHAARVAVALDADPAGREATVHAYELLRVAYPRPECVQLPDGTDPAALAAAGNGELAAVLDQPTRPLADAVVDHAIAAHDLSDAQQLVVANRHAAHVIAGFPADQIARQVARVADRLHLDVAAVTEAVTDAFTRRHDPPRRQRVHHRRDDAVPTRMTAAERAVAHLPRIATNGRKDSQSGLSGRTTAPSSAAAPSACWSPARRSFGPDLA